MKWYLFRKVMTMRVISERNLTHFNSHNNRAKHSEEILGFHQNLPMRSESIYNNADCTVTIYNNYNKCRHPLI